MESASNMKKLHTLSFEIRNVKQSKVNVDTQQAEQVMEKGPSCLRRLSVNGLKWEVCSRTILVVRIAFADIWSIQRDRGCQKAAQSLSGSCIRFRC